MTGNAGYINTTGGGLDPSQTLTLTNAGTGLIVEGDVVVKGELQGDSPLKIGTDIDMQENKIVNTIAPTSSGDVTTKAYSDSATQTMTNKTLTSPVINTATIDGHASSLYLSNSIYRQAIINGNFDIWQRNTTFTNPANNTYTADRWFREIQAGGGTALAVNFKRSTTTPDVSIDYSMEIEITNVGVADSARREKLVQKIEDYTKFQGKTISASFWIKSSTAMTLSGGLLQFYDGVASGNTVVNSLTTTWTKYTIDAFTVDSSANRLQLGFIIDPGGSTVSTTGSIYISQFQVNEGSTALPFQPKSFGDELQACKRYFQKSYDYAAFPGAGTVAGYWISAAFDTYLIYAPMVILPVQMRVAVTVTYYSYSTGVAARWWDASSSADVSGIGAINATANGFQHQGNGVIVAGRYYQMHWTVDAEL